MPADSPLAIATIVQAVEQVPEHLATGAPTEGFDAGKVIIEHVSNSEIDHPLIQLPKVFGIDFSVTKHVFMLWLVAGVIFLVVTWVVRRKRQQLLSFLLRHSRIYGAGGHWTLAHRRWLGFDRPRARLLSLLSLRHSRAWHRPRGH